MIFSHLGDVCAQPPQTLSATDLKAYAQACGVSQVYAKTGIDPTKYVYNGQVDWGAVSHDAILAHTGVDLDINVLNSDGSVNWRTVVGDSGAIGGAAACTALGLGAISPVCSSAGAKLAQAIYDFTDWLQGGSNPEAEALFAGTVYIGARPSTPAALTISVGWEAQTNPELVRRLLLVRGMAISTLTVAEGLVTSSMSIQDVLKVVGTPPFAGWTWLLDKGFASFTDLGACSTLFSGPGSWLFACLPASVKPTQFDQWGWWATQNLAPWAIDPDGYAPGPDPLESQRYDAWLQYHVSAASSMTWTVYRKIYTNDGGYWPPPDISNAWCGNNTVTGFRNINVYYPSAMRGWANIDPSSAFGMSAAFFDAQVASWAANFKAQAEAMAKARVIFPVSRTSSGSSGGGVILVALGLALAVALAVGNSRRKL